MIKTKELISQIDRPSPDSSSRINDYRFDRNERTTLFSDDEFSNMLSQLTPYDFVAYGELEPFYNKITKWLNVNRNNILLTSGSDMGIRTVFETFINKGDKVLITQPNYAMFSVYNKMFGGLELVESYQKDLTLNINSILQKLTKKVKLVVISNPSHTGKVLKQKELLKIIEKAKKQGILVIIDEAYFHFYDKSVISYINEYNNLIVSRTFSKAFGLASLRIGLLVANNNLINELYRVKLVHEITGVAAKIGSFMLDNINIVDNYVKDVNKGKEVLYRSLAALGIKTYRSDTNFLFFTMPAKVSAKDFISFLSNNKIFIKGPFINHPFTGQFRVTVGDKKQMEIFCNLVEKYIRN